MLRKALFWLHLSAGVVAGGVILVMSATGVLLTYEKQMIAWADRSDRALPPHDGAARLSIDALVAAAGTQDPAVPVTNLTLSSVAGAPALATVGSTVVTLNAYTGEVLGPSAPRLRGFFRSVTSWHRYLGATNGPLRQTLRAVTGWSNLLFFFLVLGGIYLWFPRRFTWAHVRAVTLFRREAQGRARDFNWHNVVGIWSCVPLALVVVGALPISFPWANRAAYQLVGEQPPAPQRGQGDAATNGRSGGRSAGAERGEAGRGERGAPRAERRDVPAVALDPLWRRAEAQVDGWRTVSARIGGNGPLAFTIDRGTGGQPQLRGTLTVDRASGEVVRWEPFASQTTGRRLRSFLRFAHTGEFFGVAGQTVAGLASAGGVVLVYTGLALAVRRFVAWLSRRRRVTASVMGPTSSGLVPER